MVLAPLTPYEWQEHDIAATLKAGATGLLRHEVGAGKTLIATEVGLRGDFDTVLVVALKPTITMTWIATIERQDPNIKVQRIDSTIAGKAAYASLKAKVPGWYIITPQYFTRLDWARVTPDLAIVDECHVFSNRRSAQGRKLHTLKAKSRLCMSATPWRNKIENAWNLIKWMFPSVAGNGFWLWVGRTLRTEYDPFASGNKRVVGELRPGIVVESLPFYIQHSRRKACCKWHPEGFLAHLAAPTVEHREVELTREQRRVINELEDHAVAWLDENPMVADVPIVMRQRIRQVTLGTPTVSETGEVDFADDCQSPKLDELLDILEHHPDEKAVVFTSSRRFARVATQRLNDNGIEAAEWSGKYSQTIKDKAMLAFQTGPLRVIVAVISAFGTGTDGAQHAASVEVWLDISEDPTDNEQGEGRTDRQGQKTQVSRYYIIAKDSPDDGTMSKQRRTRMVLRQSYERTRPEQAT